MERLCDLENFLNSNYTLYEIRDAIMMASEAGHDNVVEILLPHFVEANLMDEKDVTGKTALDWAKENEHSKVINLLTPYYQ